MTLRITVLGASGFIGSHIVQFLERQGKKPYAPARGDEAIFHEELGDVIYAIGLTADFRERPFDTVDAHICVLNRLLRGGNFSSLTYLSSTRIYANGSQTDEAAALPVSPYGLSDFYNLSKIMGESLCLNCGSGQMKVARLSNVIGLRKDPDIFVDQLLEEGRRTGKVHFQTSLASRKDYIDVWDAVELLVRIATSGEKGIFNVASGEAVSNGEIARFLVDRMGFDYSVACDAPLWAFAPIDISRVRTTFGYSPRRFSEYFPSFLDDYCSTKGLP
jgi:nucleoside-diphosphate-sugar epimerase